MPPEDDKNACVIIEAGYLTRICPKGLCTLKVAAFI